MRYSEVRKKDLLDVITNDLVLKISRLSTIIEESYLDITKFLEKNTK